MTAPPTSMAELLRTRRTLVCVGTGGVGKTTLAASLALAGAISGQRTMVLTIDPAHQLARALGLASLGLEPEVVDLTPFGATFAQRPGRLDAAMLDQKGAWDAFIKRHANDPEIQHKLLGNRFYQRLSTSFAGSTEFMAIEEMCRLEESRKYDLLVIDTPPAASAVDFLRAPERIETLLDPRVVDFLAGPLGRWSRDPLPGAFRGVGRLLERVAGASTIREIATFFVAFNALFGDISGRIARAKELFRRSETAFVLITKPEVRATHQADQLLGVLSQVDGNLGATILNRVAPSFDASIEDVEHTIDQLERYGLAPPEVEWLARVWGEARHAAKVQEELVKSSNGRSMQSVFVRLPELCHDAHSLADLVELAQRMGALHLSEVVKR